MNLKWINQIKFDMKNKSRLIKKIIPWLVLLVVVNVTSMKAGEHPDDGKRKPISFGTVTPEPEPKLMLGACIGSPTGVSALGSLNLGQYGVRLSTGVGSYGWQGGQLDLTYLVSRWGGLRHDVSLSTGVFRFDNSDTTTYTQVENEFYVGAAYTILYQGFHFQLGFAYGAGDYSHTVALFEVGYLFKVL